MLRVRIVRIAVLVGLSFIAISHFTACSTKNTNQNEPVIHADWPVYSIEQLVDGQSDLVVIAKVSSIKDVPGQDELQVQLSQLDIQELFYGEPENSPILLYQSIDKVKLNQSYLLFLKFRPENGYYVIADGNSLTVVPDDVNLMKSSEQIIEVKVKGIQGKYSVDELHEVFAAFEQ